VVNTTLTHALLVGAGGFIGSVLRFAVSGGVHRFVPMSTFPWGTFTVNVTGCLLIGILGGLGESRQLFSGEARVFLFLGLLGGFTTFSTFGYETLALMRDAEHLRAAGNILLNVVAGLLAAWLGLMIARLA
jgi:CrcB protein